MKILLLFFLSIILIFGTYLVLDYYGLFSREIFTATVVELRGSNILLLSNNRRVLLAGARIPEDDEVNYDKELTNNFRNYIEGRTLKFKVILPKLKTQHYPLYDTVLAYLPNKELINERILKEGMAFFDHGWYPNKHHFERLERKARKRRKGLWENIEKYKIVYVSTKNFWDYYLPDNPEVRNIPLKDKINYYFQPPHIEFYRTAGEDVIKKWGEEQKTKNANQ